jgi:hypothetical protein
MMLGRELPRRFAGVEGDKKIALILCSLSSIEVLAGVY